MEDSHVIKKTKLSNWFWTSLGLFILIIYLLGNLNDYNGRTYRTGEYIKELNNKIKDNEDDLMKCDIKIKSLKRFCGNLHDQILELESKK
jgi:hypothetical protein